MVLDVRSTGWQGVVLLLSVSTVRLVLSQDTPMSCSYRGHVDPVTQRCQCMSGFTGPDCSQRLCEVGRAWADYSTGTDAAHAKWTECSAMGFCNRESGQCVCRDGFEGSGCQYLACPKGSNGKTCSDHGKCYTMREAAVKFDGRTLTRPSVKYDNWDADQIQGCVCDEVHRVAKFLFGFCGCICSNQSSPSIFTDFFWLSPGIFWV
jgi:hypothetical protein